MQKDQDNSNSLLLPNNLHSGPRSTPIFFASNPIRPKRCHVWPSSRTTTGLPMVETCRRMPASSRRDGRFSLHWTGALDT